MGLLGNLFGGPRAPVVREEPVLDRPAPLLNPVTAGNMLVYHLLIRQEDAFCIPAAEYESIAAELPEEIRGSFASWAPLYLAWRMRLFAGHIYGPECQAQMTDAAFAAIKEMPVPETDIPLRELRNCFSLLDEVLDTFLQKGAPIFNGEPIPFAYLAALRLLTATDGLAKESGKVHGDMELGVALARLDDQTTETFPALLKAVSEK